MPRKLDYNEVKKYVEENGKCKLISTEYKNSNSPLLFECECGQKFSKTFYKFKKSLMICKNCLCKKTSKKYRLLFDDVKKYIENNGCEYISGEYINYSSKLKLKCQCGNIFEKDFSHFKRGQNRCPLCGNKSLKEKKKKYDKELVIKILNDRKIILLSDYIDSYKDIECMCSKGHKFTTKFQYILYNKFGCLQCSQDFHKGENANHYKGGESEVLDDLRKSIKEWKKQVLKKYNYQCFITHTKKDLVVHHLKPFIEIVEESCLELNIPIYKKIGEYKNNDYYNLKDLVIKKHTTDLGIVISRKIHSKFHSLYGKKNNTREQFEQFIKIHYSNLQKI